jgi:hypothetical protein
MLLVFLAHFDDVYLRHSGSPAEDAVERLTLCATPSFMLVSGLVLGFLFATRRGAFDGIRRKLLDRAFFLLTVAHVLIALSNAPRHGFAGALDAVYITDVVGVCVILGSLVVVVLGRRARAALGLGLYAFATATMLVWDAREGSAAQLLKQVLVGPHLGLESNALRYNFPIAQWLAVYLVGTALGDWLSQSSADLTRVVVRLGMLGSTLFACGALLRLLRPVLQPLGSFLDPHGSEALWLFESPSQKLPPGPVYVLCYVGAACLLVAGSLWLGAASPDGPAIRGLALLGRNSLIAFVAQYALYYSAMTVWQIPYSSLWPLVFATSTALLVGFVAFWERLGGVRLLTIGYPALVRRFDGFERGRQ